jgi:hypothetical protein
MDKKKIFKLTFLLLFFHSQAFASSIIYTFANKQTHYEDSNKNISNVNINFFKNISQFDYYLLEFNDNSFEEKTINKKKEFKNKKQLADFNKSVILKVNDNIVITEKIIKELNKSYEPIFVSTKKIDINKETLRDILGKNKDNAIYKYYLSRLNKNYVSDWYFKKDRGKIIMQKIDNKYITSKDFYLFFIISNPINIPEKINIRYSVSGNQKKYRGLYEVNINKENIFKIEEKEFIYFAKVQLFNKENLINQQNDIIINETIIFYNSNKFSLDSLFNYEILEIKNNIKYYILINNKHILLPDGLFLEKDKKLVVDKNIMLNGFLNASSIQNSINLEGFKLKKWNNKLENLIDLLADNENNKFLYINNFEVKAQPGSSTNFANIIINYLIFTPVYLFLIIFSLTRNFEIKKFNFDFIFKSGIIIITSLFLLNFIQQIFMTNYNIYLLSFINPIEVLFGYTLFFIYIIIIFVKKVNKN